MMRKIITMFMLAVALTGCGSSMPSLQGAWVLEGAAKPSDSQTLTFTAMDFQSDGTVKGTLLPQAPIIASISPTEQANAIAPKPFTFTYVIDKPGSVIVREPGSSDALTLTYEIKQDELYLTMPIFGSSTVRVYKRAAE